MLIRWIFVIVLTTSTTRASLSQTFLSWTSETYSPKIAERLNRLDLGNGGSFGGGNHTANQKTRRRPVIFVNGMTSRIDHYADNRDYFKQRGYRDEELYGTTYGTAGNVSMFSVTMECDFSRRIRELIIAVHSFTNSKVDILAFSMGSPVARKALLGGICVDTGEDLGSPLTSLVDTFVSVGGANHGSYLCVFSFIKACNVLNGLICTSKYLADINSVKRYEGSHIFTIYSRDDEYAGYEVCGRLTTPIDGQDQGYEFSNINHEETLKDTVAIQYELITNHRVKLVTSKSSAYSKWFRFHTLLATIVFVGVEAMCCRQFNFMIVLDD